MISEEYTENENRYIVKGFAKKESNWLAESEKRIKNGKLIRNDL